MMYHHDSVSFNEEAFAGMILQHILGSSKSSSATGGDRGNNSNQNHDDNGVIDLTDDVQFEATSESYCDDISPDLVILMIDDQIHSKWESVAKKYGKFLIDMNDKCRKLCDGTATFLDTITLITLLKVIKSCQSAFSDGQAQHRKRIYNQWTERMIQEGWIDFLYHIAVCCIPSFRKSIRGLERNDTFVLLVTACSKSILKNVFLNIDIAQFPYQDDYGLRSFLENFGFSYEDIKRDFRFSFHRKGVPVNIKISISAVDSAQFATLQAATPQFQPTISATNTTSATINVTTDSSIEATSPLKATPVTSVNPSDTIMSPNVNGTPNHSNTSPAVNHLPPQEVVGISNNTPSQGPTPVLQSPISNFNEDHNSQEEGDDDDVDDNMKSSNRSPEDNLHREIEKSIMNNWVTIALSSEASFLIDMHNMIGKSKEETLDESSVKVLHQIIDALKITRVSKADRATNNFDSYIYQDWTMRKILSGWKKFLFQMWAASIPNWDKNNPRDVVISGVKSSEAYGWAKQSFSICLFKRLFFELKLVYQYQSTNETVVIELTPKDILSTFLTALQNVVNSAKQKSASTSKRDRASKSSNKRSKLDNGNNGSGSGDHVFKHRLLTFSQLGDSNNDEANTANQDSSEDEDNNEVAEDGDEGTENDDALNTTDGRDLDDLSQNQSSIGSSRKRQRDEVNHQTP